MTAITTPSPLARGGDHQTKPAWRYARERRLGKRARALVGHAEAHIPRCLAILGADVVLQATRENSWALACLERAAGHDEASEEQDAWVLLAACRPTLVRRAIHGRRVPRGEGRRQTSRRLTEPAAPKAAPSPAPIGWRAQLTEIGETLGAATSGPTGGESGAITN